jgi:hypothetical protein
VFIVIVMSSSQATAEILEIVVKSPVVTMPAVGPKINFG